MTIMAIIILLGFSAPVFMESYYYNDMVKPYGENNIVMKVSENTPTRYFSVRQLKEYPNLDTFIKKWTPLFEINTLVGYSVYDKQYTKVVASELEHFSSINSHLNYQSSYLSDNEAIITKTLAFKHNLTIGSTITLYVGTSAKLYYVVDIVKDDGLFQNNSIFINKQGSLLFFLNALNPNIVIPNPQFLTNLYNTVYFETQPNISTQEGIEVISSINEYRLLETMPTVDYASVKQLVDRSLSIYRVIISMIFIAIIVVIQSTYLMYFESRKKQFAVINILGGRVHYSYLITMIEFFIFYIVAMLISNIGSTLIMNLGFKYIGIDQAVTISLLHRLIGAVVLAVIFTIISTFYFHQFQKSSSIVTSIEQGKESFLSRRIVLVVLFVCVFSYLIISIIQLLNPEMYVLSIVSVILSVVLLFFGSVAIVHLAIVCLKNNKKFAFFKLQLQMLVQKKTFYQFTVITLISILSIFLLVLVNTHMEERIVQTNEDYKTDYIMTNIVANFDQVHQEVMEMDSVSEADPVYLARNVVINENQQMIPQLVAIDPTKINSHYGYEMNNLIIESLIQNENAVVLPKRYEMLYHFSAGDIISLYISRENKSVDFVIVGFYENNIGNIGFINLTNLKDNHQIQSNTIFVKEKEQYFGLREVLIEQFSKNLIIIIDNNELIQNYVKQVRINTNYMIYIISIMIVCFVISIVSYTSMLFEDMKTIYSKSMVIGASKWLLMKQTLYETILFVSIYIGVSICIFLLIGKELSLIVLLFGEYEPINVSKNTILNGVLIGLFVIIVSRIIYSFKIRSLDLSQKMHMQTF